MTGEVISDRRHDFLLVEIGVPFGSRCHQIGWGDTFIERAITEADHGGGGAFSGWAHQHGPCFAVRATGPSLIETLVHLLALGNPGMHALAHFGEVRCIPEPARLAGKVSVGLEDGVQNPCGVGVETVFVGPLIPVVDDFHQIRHGLAVVHLAAPALDGAQLRYILLCMSWAHRHHDEQA